MSTTIQIEQPVPEIRQRADGNWQVQTGTYHGTPVLMAGPTQVAPGQWAFASEQAARTAALSHTIKRIEIEAAKQFNPSVIRATPDPMPEPWWVTCDRNEWTLD